MNMPRKTKEEDPRSRINELPNRLREVIYHALSKQAPEMADRSVLFRKVNVEDVGAVIRKAVEGDDMLEGQYSANRQVIEAIIKSKFPIRGLPSMKIVERRLTNTRKQVADFAELFK